MRYTIFVNSHIFDNFIKKLRLTGLICKNESEYVRCVIEVIEKDVRIRERVVDSIRGW